MTTVPTPLARRLGPVVVVGSLVVTLVVVLVVGVLSVPRHPALAGSGTDVPAALLVGPDADGCLTLLEGDGTVRASACDERVAWAPARALGGTEVVVEVWEEPLPGEDGEVRVPGDRADPFVGPGQLLFDLADGSLEPTEEVVWDERVTGGHEPWERVDGPRVRGDDDEVLLELDGPRDAWPDQAVLSPDGRWLVVQDGYGRVLAAEVGGDPLVWSDDEQWVDLATAVAWDG